MILFPFLKDYEVLLLIQIKLSYLAFDINSLVTNVPLDETIDIIVNKTFNNSALYNGSSLLQFRKVLCHSV